MNEIYFVKPALYPVMANYADVETPVGIMLGPTVF